MRENLILMHAKNKGADQSAHPRSLISTFVIRYLYSTMIQLPPCKISIFELVSVAELNGLGLTWSEAQKTGFSHVEAHIRQDSSV